MPFILIVCWIISFLVWSILDVSFFGFEVLWNSNFKKIFTLINLLMIVWFITALIFSESVSEVKNCEIFQKENHQYIIIDKKEINITKKMGLIINIKAENILVKTTKAQWIWGIYVPGIKNKYIIVKKDINKGF